MDYTLIDNYLKKAFEDVDSEDYEDSLFHTRQSLEAFVKSLCKEANINYYTRDNQINTFSLINTLQENGILTDREKNTLHGIRAKCNEGVHVDIDNPSEASASVLRIANEFLSFVNSFKQKDPSALAGKNEPMIDPDFHSDTRPYYGKWENARKDIDLRRDPKYIHLLRKAEDNGDISAMLDLASGFLPRTLDVNDSGFITKYKGKEPNSDYYKWIVRAVLQACKNIEESEPVPMRYLATAVWEALRISRRYVYSIFGTYEDDMYEELLLCHQDALWCLIDVLFRDTARVLSPIYDDEHPGETCRMILCDVLEGENRLNKAWPELYNGEERSVIITDETQKRLAEAFPDGDIPEGDFPVIRKISERIPRIKEENLRKAEEEAEKARILEEKQREEAERLERKRKEQEAFEALSDDEKDRVLMERDIKQAEMEFLFIPSCAYFIPRYAKEWMEKYEADLEARYKLDPKVLRKNSYLKKHPERLEKITELKKSLVSETAKERRIREIEEKYRNRRLERDQKTFEALSDDEKANTIQERERKNREYDEELKTRRRERETALEIKRREFEEECHTLHEELNKTDYNDQFVKGFLAYIFLGWIIIMIKHKEEGEPLSQALKIHMTFGTVSGLAQILYILSLSYSLQYIAEFLTIVGFLLAALIRPKKQ